MSAALSLRSTDIDALRQLKLFMQQRLLYEPIALALAIPRLSSDDIFDAERILVEYDLKTKARSRVAVALDFNIHLMMRCDNANLLTKVSRIHKAVLNSLSDQASLSLVGERAQNQHWRLLEFCRRGRVDSAVDSLLRSIEDACLSLSNL